MCGLEVVKTMRTCHRFNRSVIILAGGIVFLLLFTACPKVKVPKTVRRVSGAGDSKLDVKVHVSPNANNNNPVAVDLVLVSDKKLLQELMKMSASEWFEKRHQVELDYPKETALNAGRWEWVPGQDVKVDQVPVKMEIVGGVVFANYFNAGPHRAPIDPRKGILITLGDENLCVQSVKEAAKPCAPAKQSGK
jgi:type VI secretion system protein